MQIRIIITALMLSGAPALAQHAHGDHSAHGMQGAVAVAETGQAQFAAIAEIVALLRADPSTDWAQVDIQALRDHLVDMDNVTTGSVVSVKEDGLDVIFTVTGTGAVVDSIQEMVVAHSPMLSAETGWPVTASVLPDGAMMTITAADVDQVLGLGFYGVMAIGAHHQQHHLMIANGHSPH